MAALPKISVVTRTFNSRHKLRETVDGVLGQNYSNYGTNGGILKATGEVVNILNSDNCYRPAEFKPLPEAPDKINNSSPWCLEAATQVKGSPE